jgi:hypothetical protein
MYYGGVQVVYGFLSLIFIHVKKFKWSSRCYNLSWLSGWIKKITRASLILFVAKFFYKLRRIDNVFSISHIHTLKHTHTNTHTHTHTHTRAHTHTHTTETNTHINTHINTHTNTHTLTHTHTHTHTIQYSSSSIFFLFPVLMVPAPT